MAALLALPLLFISAACSGGGSKGEATEDQGPTTAAATGLTRTPASFNVTLSATTSEHGTNGNCPLVLARVEMDGPGSVSFRWTRSDGSPEEFQELTFSAAGIETLEQDWLLTKMPAEGVAWIGFETSSPIARDWGKVDVLPCQGGVPTPTPTTEPTITPSDEFSVVAVTLRGDKWSDDYYKECAVVYAEIEVDGPGTVAYRWHLSDRDPGPRQVLEFTEAGKQTIEETWSLSSGAPDQEYWIGLLIEAPQEKDWGRVEVERCKEP
ncbi:MAG: hypothetical protein ACE5EF_10465 [Dehalococcoidia bacterium]